MTHEDVVKIKRSLRQYWDRSADEYDRFHYTGRGEYSPLLWRQRYVERMLDAAGLPCGARVLDAGCGPGELLVSLANRGLDPWGVDISTSMVEIARARVSKLLSLSSDRIKVGDIEALPFESGSFSAAIAAGVIEYQKRDEPTLAEMNRVLKPGGYLILNVTNSLTYLNWLGRPYLWLRRQVPVVAAHRFITQRVMGKGPVPPLPNEGRTHTPGGFDRRLARTGFKKVDYNFFHFSPLPTPFDSVCRRWCDATGLRMESATQHAIAPWIAGGYLVMAQKVAERR
jgi:ubiquinone/menaquinone biosynthesis C-methylase UbiE